MDSRQWDERYSGDGYEWKTEPNQFVAAELAGLPPGRALDLAAGEGRNSVWLAQRGWRVTVMRTVWTEKHDAVAIGAVAVRVGPFAGHVQAHHRLDPT